MSNSDATTMQDDPLLDVAGAAKELAVSKHTVYRWSAEGKLPTVKVGRCSRFRRSALRAWLAQHSTDTEH